MRFRFSASISFLERVLPGSGLFSFPARCVDPGANALPPPLPVTRKSRKLLLLPTVALSVRMQFSSGTGTRGVETDTAAEEEEAPLPFAFVANPVSCAAIHLSSFAKSGMSPPCGVWATFWATSLSACFRSFIVTPARVLLRLLAASRLFVIATLRSNFRQPNARLDLRLLSLPAAACQLHGWVGCSAAMAAAAAPL